MNLTPKPNKKFGKWLKQKRQDVNTSQREVANELGYTTPQFVSNWERGLITPPLTTCYILADLYNIPRGQMDTALIDAFRDGLAVIKKEVKK